MFTGSDGGWDYRYIAKQLNLLVHDSFQVIGDNFDYILRLNNNLDNLVTTIYYDRCPNFMVAVK